MKIGGDEADLPVVAWTILAMSILAWGEGIWSLWQAWRNPFQGQDDFENAAFCAMALLFAAPCLRRLSPYFRISRKPFEPPRSRTRLPRP